MISLEEYMANESIHGGDFEEFDEEELEGEVGRPRRRPAGPYGGRPPRGQDTGRRFRPRRKVCFFCVERVKVINYKDVQMVQRFLDDHAKILPRRKTGTCARHQRTLALAIKQARQLALLPFVGQRSPYER